MRDILLAIREADAHTFAGYGSVVPYPALDRTEPAYEPSFAGDGFSWYGRLLRERFDGDLSFGMVVSEASRSFEQRIFERHQQTVELLVPLDGDVVLILGQTGAIARPLYAEHRDGTVDPLLEHRFGAFHVAAGQAVVLGRGVWHYAPLAAQRTRILTCYREGTEVDDVDAVDLAELDARVVARARDAADT